MKYKPLVPEVVAIHCAATPPTLDIGAEDIRRWHREKGWFDIGYHFVIRRDGTVENGRDIKRPGAHARGHNHNSVGICLAGGVDADKKPDNNFTQEQFKSLEDLLMKLVSAYDIHTVIGHRDFPNVKKVCPSFDVTAWLSETGDVRQTLAQIIYQNSLHYED